MCQRLFNRFYMDMRIKWDNKQKAAEKMAVTIVFMGITER